MTLYDVYRRTRGGDCILAGSFLAEEAEEALRHLPPARPGERYLEPEPSHDAGRYEAHAAALARHARQARAHGDWTMERIWQSAADELRRQSAALTTEC